MQTTNIDIFLLFLIVITLTNMFLLLFNFILEKIIFEAEALRNRREQLLNNISNNAIIL